MKTVVVLLALAALVRPVAFAQNKAPAATNSLATAAAALAASTNSTPIADRFKSPQEKISYSIGVMIASDMQRNLKRGGYEVNPEVVAKAFTEGFNGRSTVVTTAEAESVVRAYTTELRQKAEEKRKAEGDKNKAEGQKFLAENKTKPGIITLPSGLQYQVITQGTGAKPTTNDTVVTHYRGTLLDGTEFDSSYSRNQPATFGVSRVIKGWTEALQLMSVGSKWKLFVPSELAYGSNGSPPKIGPNAVLTFDIELQDIKPPTQAINVSPTAGAVTSDIIKVPSKADLDKGAKIEVIKKDEVERIQKEAAARRATNPPPVPGQK